MNCIARFFTFLTLLFLANMQIVAESETLEGLWVVGKINDIKRWGFYFEGDAFYYACCLGDEWFYSIDEPLGHIESGDKENVFVSQDFCVRINVDGEKFYMKSTDIDGGSVGFIAKKNSGIKPKETTMKELETKEKKYKHKNLQRKLEKWITNLKSIFRS